MEFQPKPKLVWFKPVFFMFTLYVLSAIVGILGFCASLNKSDEFCVKKEITVF